MIEKVLTEMHDLLGTDLFHFIMNPKTNRPLLMSSLKKRRRYSGLSTGEKTLIHLAYDIYNGSGQSKFVNLYSLDYPSRIRAVKALENFLQITNL